MAKKLFIFEDDKFSHFYPLTYNRPVYELLCGISKIREKIAGYFSNPEITLLCRDFLAPVLAEKTKGCGIKINDFEVADADEIILVNGRVLPDENFKKEIPEKESLLFHNENLVIGKVSGNMFKKNSEGFQHLYSSSKIKHLKESLEVQITKLDLVNYLWELVGQSEAETKNASEIRKDFMRLKPGLDFKNMFKHNQVDGQAVIFNLDNVYIGKKVEVEAFCLLNAQKGPIYIDDGAKILAHTRIEGPCYIGKDSQIVGGKIREGCSIGPNCRIGGEIEETVFLGYSNKYHEGFMGHSYLGEWVNLGSGTHNSDLKNNYGSVKVAMAGKELDTKFSKAGCFIGDHVKTGIGTLLSTGICIGLGSNLWGGGMFAQKFIPAFVWGDNQALQQYHWEKFIQTAQTVMERRKVSLSSAEKELLQRIYELTLSDRTALKR